MLGTVAYIGAFAMGAGPIPALLLGELVEDPKARGKVTVCEKKGGVVCTFGVGLAALMLS